MIGLFFGITAATAALGASGDPGTIQTRSASITITAGQAAVEGAGVVNTTGASITLTANQADVLTTGTVDTTSASVTITAGQASIETATAPSLDTLGFVDNNDGTPAVLNITYTGNVTGYRVYIATGDATFDSDEPTSGELYAGSGAAGALEYADYAVGTSIDITGLTSSSEPGVRIAACLIKSVDGSDPSNVEVVTVSGLDFTGPSISWATNAAGTQIIGTAASGQLYFSQDTADWAVNDVTGGSATVDSVTGSGTGTITVGISGNLVLNGDSPTIDYTDSDTNLRDQDGNTQADFADVSVTNNVPAGGGITFETSSTATIATDGAQTKTTVALPTSAENDLVILAAGADAAFFHGTSSNSGITFDSGDGWTAVRVGGSGVANPGPCVLLKLMGATPDTTIGVWPATGRQGAVGMIVLDGVDTGTPQDQTATTATGTSTTPDPASITTQTDGALVVAIMVLDDRREASNIVAPSGYSNLVVVEAGTTDSNGATVAIATKEVTTAAAEDPPTFTGISTGDAWECITLAIKPA